MHHGSVAWPFRRCMISMTTLGNRKSDFRVNDWILDSGAYTELARFGRWRTKPEVYAEAIHRWRKCGNLVAAVTQDMPCDPPSLAKTKLSVQAHQGITISRYAEL